MLKRITHVKCLVPFTDFVINPRGYCYSCCPAWTIMGNVGRLTPKNSMMDIWNNERMQYIRKAVLDDRLDDVCNMKYCPIAINNEPMYLESMKNEDPNFNWIIDQIIMGRTILESPPYQLNANISGKCNLRCIMCRSNDKYIHDDDLLTERLYTKDLPAVLPGISRLFLAGNGEVLFNPYSRKFLQSLEPARYPGLTIQLLTNGLMLTPKLWESIDHNFYAGISVSVDAASKATYEKIRKNGKWEILRRNLDFVSELRRQNRIPEFTINFCVMKSNYKEMKGFVELGLSLGCDHINFQKIYSVVDLRENINWINNTKVFAEIGKILTDPVFQRPEVHTIQIDEYRAYAGKTVPWMNQLVAKGKEWLFYIPVKAVFSTAKYLPYTLDIYEFLHKRKIPVSNN